MIFDSSKGLKIVLTATDGGKKSFRVPANAPDFHTRVVRGIIQASGGQAVWLDLENPETKQRIRIFVPTGRYGHSTRFVDGGGASDTSLLARVSAIVTAMHSQGFSAMTVTGKAGRFTISVEYRDTTVADPLANTTDVESVTYIAGDPNGTGIRDRL